MSYPRLPPPWGDPDPDATIPSRSPNESTPTRPALPQYDAAHEPYPPQSRRPRRSRRIWLLGSGILTLLVVIVGSVAVVKNRSTTSSRAHIPTATVSTPMRTAAPTETQPTQPVCPQPTPLPSTEKPILLTSPTDIDAFPLPGLPARSVLDYFTSQDSEDAARIQHRTIYACTPGTAASVEQDYATLFTAWASCDPLCWDTTGGNITRTVRIADINQTNGMSVYQLTLDLKAAVIQPDTGVPPGPITFVPSSPHDDMQWDGTGTLKLASTTDMAPAGCTSTAMQFKQLQQLSYNHAQGTITLTPGEATVRCFQTANGSFVVFSATYTSNSSTLTISYAAYVAGFS